MCAWLHHPIYSRSVGVGVGIGQELLLENAEFTKKTRLISATIILLNSVTLPHC